ncbi:M23 family metallopeptidase [Candidatus Dojkabacteria bacterium]|uniref:M23 family metallopeptidase n=1 Tax=Candidatus Dojkabacteria bacterium TaxID=2099670 RepID=A0A955L9D4_9BACT|nr:M23 family metallopeptidase [Candidatus Dojkabacteria bacterium]
MKRDFRFFTITFLVVINLLHVGLVVRAQEDSEIPNSYEYTFPYTPVPEDAVDEFETEEDSNRLLLSEGTISFLRQYFGSLFMAPRHYLDRDFRGPELSYSKNFFIDWRNDIVIDTTLRQDPVRDWLCKIQEDLPSEQQVNSQNAFCAYANGKQGDVVRPTDPVCTTNPDGGISEYALHGPDGKDYYLPIDPGNNPESFNDINKKGYEFGDTTFYTFEYNPPLYHEGLDLLYPTGTPIIASNYGTVALARLDSRTAENPSVGYGNLIIVNHEFEDGQRTQTLYAHLSEILVTEGTYVRPGDVIGYMGNTGRSTTPHIHFEVRTCTAFGPSGSCENRVKIDPKPLITFDLTNLLAGGETEPVRECVGSPDGFTYDGDIHSFECILDIAANAVGNVPPEALYAISQNESKSCPNTWAQWYGISGVLTPNGQATPLTVDTDLNTINLDLAIREAEPDRQVCTGDPTQIAHASRNLWNDQPIDVRGVSQFTSGTFNSQLLATDDSGGSLMQQCVSALGGDQRPIEVPPEGHECRDKVTLRCLDEFWGYDNLSAKPYQYSRHIVSHVVCAKAIKLRNDAGNIPVDQWTDETMYNVARRYYGWVSNPENSPNIEYLKNIRACNDYGKDGWVHDYCDAAVETYNSPPDSLYECRVASTGNTPTSSPTISDTSIELPANVIEIPEPGNPSNIRGYMVELETIVQNSSASSPVSIDKFMQQQNACSAVNTNFYTPTLQPIGLYGDTYNACPTCDVRDFIDTAVVSYNGAVPPRLQARLQRTFTNGTEQIGLFTIYDESNPSDPTGTDTLFNGLDINWAVSGYYILENGQNNGTSSRAAEYPYLGLTSQGDIYAIAFNAQILPADQLASIQAISEPKIIHAILMDGGKSAQLKVGEQLLVDGEVNHYFIGSQCTN